MIDLNLFKDVYNRTFLNILKDAVTYYTDYFVEIEENGESDKSYDSGQIRYILKELNNRLKQLQ